MLNIHLNFDKLRTATGKDLHGQDVNFGGVTIGCNLGACAAAGYPLYCIEMKEVDSTVPDAIKDMVDFFCYEEEIAGSGKQWRQGHYRHRSTGDADAFFDGSYYSAEACTLKMRATNQANLIALRQIVLQVKPGDRNRIDGLIEPPIDDWNAGYEARIKANEAAKPTYEERLAIAGLLVRTGVYEREELQAPFKRWLATQPDPAAENQFIIWAANVLLA